MLQCTVEHQGTVADSFFIKKGGSSKKGPQSGRQPIPAIKEYFRSVSFYRLFSSLMNQTKLVKGSFGQTYMHSKHFFCPMPARKEMNVSLNKKS